MPYCCVPKCVGGSKKQRMFFKENNIPKLRFFKPRTEEIRKNWESLIKSTNPLKRHSAVCSAHFLEEDVILEEKFIIRGQIHLMPRDKGALKRGAIPVRYLQEPPPFYQQKTIMNKERKPSKEISIVTFQKSSKPRQETDENAITKSLKENEEPQTAVKDIGLSGPISTQDREKRKLNITSYTNFQDRMDRDKSKLIELSPISETSMNANNHTNPTALYLDNESPGDESEILTDTESSDGLQWSHDLVSKLQLPNDWIFYNSNFEDKKVLVHINHITLQIDKAIVFEAGSKPKVIFRGKVPLDYDGDINSKDSAQNLLNKVDWLRVCPGTGLPEAPFSEECGGFRPENYRTCYPCNAEKLRRKRAAARQEVLPKRKSEERRKITWTMQSLRRSNERLKLKVEKYKELIETTMTESRMKKIEVMNAINDFSPDQKKIVRACFPNHKKKKDSAVTGNSQDINLAKFDVLTPLEIGEGEQLVEVVEFEPCFQ